MARIVMPEGVIFGEGCWEALSLASHPTYPHFEDDWDRRLQNSQCKSASNGQCNFHILDT